MKPRLNKCKTGFNGVKVEELRNHKPKYAVSCQSSIINHQSSIPPGFTLLELLISFTIIGLILVIVFGSLRIGARAWEKGEKDVEMRQRERIVLDLVKRQIASMFVRVVKENDEQPFFLKGDGESMEFISRIPMVPGNRAGLVYVKYVVRPEDGGKKRLMFSEKNIYIIEKVMEDQAEEDFFELIPGAQNIEFEYLRGPSEDEEESVWQETWDPDSDKGAPLAVKIIVQDSKDTATINVIAPIESDAT
ncbi:MAG: prepilin-type N-terminal cleavage/methylation domain-containing protein [Desulfobacteraceae bacterium]|nr:prepilin-type N-terminal cleavage/methylation domain-containing protein [Desulfobacteraceae bacterium]